MIESVNLSLTLSRPILTMPGNPSSGSNSNSLFSMSSVITSASLNYEHHQTVFLGLLVMRVLDLTLGPLTSR